MSLLTQAYLLEKYGPRLTIEQTADVLGISTSTLVNQLAQRKCKIPHYRDGRVWFDYRDISEHLDTLRHEAQQALGAEHRVAA